MRTISLLKRAVTAATAIGSLLLATDSPVHAQATSPCADNSGTFGGTGMLALSAANKAYVIFPDGQRARELTVRLNDGGRLIGFDRRPSDGMLYGVSSNRGLYTLQMTLTEISGTRIATITDPPPPAAPIALSNALMMDFNPTISAQGGNALRVIDRSENNIALVSSTGGPLNNATTVVQNKVRYVAGDPGTGADPSIVAGAYDSNITPAPTVTTLYMIDSDRDTFVTINARNGSGSSDTQSGVLRTIGNLVTAGGARVDFDSRSGMDIYTPQAGTNFGVGITGRDLYCIDLQTVKPNQPAGTLANVIANKMIGWSLSLARANSMDPFLDVAVVPLQPADITIEQVTDAPDPVRSGETLEYTVKIRNLGPFDAVNVVEFNGQLFGPGLVLTNQTVTPSQGTCPNIALCQLGSLTVGSGATVTVRGTVPTFNPGSQFQGTFTAASTNPDPNNNNSVTVTTTVR